MSNHEGQSQWSALSEFSGGADDADLTPTLKVLLSGRSLSADEATRAFEAIMTGQAHHGEIGALLALLATRVPTSDEILGAARVMRDHVERVKSTRPTDELLDTAGTGGAPKTFNVSTAAAVIAAGAGATVAKHGNRSRTGRGSAEVLKQLGVNVDADRATQARCLDEAGVCFCFAIHHHPAAKHAMPVRQALGFPTMFNLLGPLTNPAGAGRQLMGVYDSVFLEPIARALAKLGAVHAIVLHSEDGLDECSIAAPTHMMHVERGTIREERVDPASLGLERSELASVTARDLPHAAAMIRAILEGTDQGPAQDMAVLNAAAALVASGIAKDFAEGVERARESTNSGAARQALQRLIDISHS